MTMINVITFNKEGRDSFIDFLKAYAIVFVLFGHTFPFLQEVGYGLYGQMQVPIFLLIQVFHTFKTEKSIRIGKIWTRIIRPFLYAQFLIVICIVVCYGADKLLIYKALSWGGMALVPIILIYIYNLHSYFHCAGNGSKGKVKSL